MDKNLVYQDPVTKALFTFRYRWKGRVIIGGGSGFYDSAIHALYRYSVSENYFYQFTPIRENSPLLTHSKLGSLCLKNWDCIDNDWVYKNIYNSKDIKYFNGDMNATRQIKKNREEMKYLFQYPDFPDDAE